MARSAAQIAKVNYRIANGLCVNCDEPATRGKRCLAHAARELVYILNYTKEQKAAREAAKIKYRKERKDRIAAAAAKKRQERKIAGICMMCPNPCMSISEFCRGCRDKHEAYRAKYKAKLKARNASKKKA